MLGQKERYGEVFSRKDLVFYALAKHCVSYEIMSSDKRSAG